MNEKLIGEINSLSDSNIDYFIQFWSERTNVENADVEPMQADILFYLNSLKHFKTKSDDMKKTLQEINEEFERFMQLTGSTWSENTTIGSRAKIYNDRLEEMQKILEWYANTENYQIEENENDPFDIKPEEVLFDNGERARQALKGE